MVILTFFYTIIFGNQMFYSQQIFKAKCQYIYGSKNPRFHRLIYLKHHKILIQIVMSYIIIIICLADLFLKLNS